MAQYNYSPYPEAIVGQLGTYATGDIISILNPLRQQVTNYHQDAAVDLGVYTIQAVSDGGQTVTASYTAAVANADTIAAGIASAINADADFAGVASASTPVGDTFNITFTQAGMDWTVTLTADPTGGVADITTSTTAGYTAVALGRILQSSGSTFTATYTNPALALGVTCRNAELVLPTDQNGIVGYDGPCMMSLVRRGEIWVSVTGTVTAGEAASYSPTTGTWDQAGTGGTFVDVPESMFRTTGSGIQRVFVNLPSET